MSSNSLLQASLQSKLPKRDLSHPLSDPLNLQAKHFTDDLCVFVTLENLSPIWTRCSLGVTKVMVNLESLYCPLLRGNLIVENRTRSW
jgi:hypothetical protein